MYEVFFYKIHLLNKKKETVKYIFCRSYKLQLKIMKKVEYIFIFSCNFKHHLIISLM